MAPRIVVPLDGSPFSTRALPLARGIAERRGGALDLVCVAVPTPQEGGAYGDQPEAEGSREFWVARAKAFLEAQAETLSTQGYRGDVHLTVLQPGNAASAVLGHLAAVKAELAVMTTHGRGPLERAWLGSTADAILRGSPCPVILSRPVDHQALDPVESTGPLPPPERILVPLDGSDVSTQILVALPAIAAPNAEIILLRVVPPFIPGGSPYLPHALRSAEDHDRIVDVALRSLNEIANQGVAGRRVIPLVVTAGSPTEAIFETAAEWAVEFIAMTTSGRGGVARFLLGSVADKVVRGATCPVLVQAFDPDGPKDA